MAIVTLPSELLLSRLTVGQRRFDLSMDNPTTGDGSTRLLGPPRWTISFNSLTEMEPMQARFWESFLLKMRGRINLLAAWDVGKSIPLGTMRGTLTLADAVTAGATQISVTGGSAQGAKTILAGDWLQIGNGLGTSQLVKVVGDAVATLAGVINLTVEPPMRFSLPFGANVTWDKPYAYYRMTSSDSTWSYEKSTQGSFSFDAIEQWR